ncbi:hypothetical protein MP228_007203 [Amoeboaphelidium protococcarum]|nr:hypothetical protein MP228_007203 [Amoeboaphelidium protococcarum]
MNYAQEQRDELEALLAIYPEELRVVRLSKSILDMDPEFASQLQIDGDDRLIDALSALQVEDASNAIIRDNTVVVVKLSPDQDICMDDAPELTDCLEIVVSLAFSLSPNYPSDAPVMHIEMENLPDRMRKQMKDQTRQWLTELEQSAQEYAEMPCVFQLAQHLKDGLDAYIQQLVDNHKHEEEQRRLAEEQEAERKRNAGTPITEETFRAWKEKFNAWRNAQNHQRQQQQIAADSNKLTGRQIFERNIALATSDGADDDESEVVVFDKSAFEDEVFSSDDDQEDQDDHDG